MKTFAFALYENEAESEDELTFKKNDLFQVLQFDYMGMEGWWLCKLLTTNQTGLAAGNRLRKITDEKILNKLNESLTSNKTNLFSNMNKLNKCFSSSSSSTSSASSISGSSNSLASSISSPIEGHVKSQCSSTFNKVLNHDTFDSSCDSLALSQQHQENKMQLQPKITLPPKLIHSSKMSINSFESNNSDEHVNTLKRSIINSKQSKSKHDESQQDNQDDDDYDYDIPVNNQPIKRQQESLNPDEEADREHKLESAQVELSDLSIRKSTSPTIDSGISTSSLMSLVSENLQTTVQLSASSSTTDETDLLSCSKFDSKRSSSSSASSPSASSRISMDNSLKQQFELKINELNRQINDIRAETCETTQRNKLNQLKYDLNEFIMKILKRIKEENACFHPNLNVFNKFKDFYRRFKEFYLFFENSLMKLELITIANETNEFIGKLSYLNDLFNSLIILANQNHVFDYDNQTTIDKLQLHQTNETKQNEEEHAMQETDYEYEYQSPKHEIYNRNETSYENNDYSDYCVIDDEPEETVVNKKAPSLALSNLRNQEIPVDPCTTLKKSEEKIRKEIRMVSSTNINTNNRINLCDQMLLKFYLKHIEDNLTELKSTYEILVENLRRINTNDSQENESLMNRLSEFGNKYAIVGHKLVFICDTLQRNLNNSVLKSTLCASSNSIGDSLKMYMIRLKSTDTFNNNNNNLAKLLNSSLDEIYTLAVEFKQIISKYYYKSH